MGAAASHVPYCGRDRNLSLKVFPAIKYDFPSGPEVFGDLMSLGFSFV